MNPNFLYPKISKEFICNCCDYTCSKKSVFEKHLLTRKHEILTNPNKFVSENKLYNCECGKEYKHHSSLCYHKKKCKFDEKNNCKNKTTEIENIDSVDYKNMFIRMMGENHKLQNLLIEQQKQTQEQFNTLIPKIGNTTTNNNSHNTNNFNINMFLNEKCKHAISMDEFIDKINISMKNLLYTKDNGLTDGLTNIFVENMNKLSLFERPIHCTDKKRETIYIKNKIHGTHDTQWSKDEENQEVEKAINKVSRKQMQNLKQWTEENPNFMNNDHLQKEYTKLIASCSKDVEKDKIKKRLCDKVYLSEKNKI
jgi:hypothetical protein